MVWKLIWNWKFKATKKIFTAISDNTVSIINYENSRQSPTQIYLENAQYDLAIDPETQMIYLATSSSNTISIVNGTSKKIVEGANFKIYPSNSGHIKCIHNNNYVETSSSGHTSLSMTL